MLQQLLSSKHLYWHRTDEKGEIAVSVARPGEEMIRGDANDGFVMTSMGGDRSLMSAVMVVFVADGDNRTDHKRCNEENDRFHKVLMLCNHCHLCLLSMD